MLVSQLVGMRLRGVPPMTVVDAYVALRKLNVPATLDHVQAFYLAHRANIKNEQDLVRLVCDHFEQNPVLSKFTNESQVPGAVWLVPVELSGCRSIRSDFLDVFALGGGYHHPP